MKTNTLKAVAALCVGASVLSAAAGALAQDGRASSPRPGVERMDRHPGRDSGPDRGLDRHDPAQRAKRLHDLLQITSGQEPAFQAWQTALRPAERPQPPRADRGALTTPQRLDERLARMDRHMAQARTRADATKRFYAQLSPSQRTAFDSLPKGRRDHDGHGRGFGRRDSGPGFGGPVGRG